MTPGGSSSPFCSFSIFSRTILRSTSIWREVISSISSICSLTRGSLSLSLMRFRLRVEMRSIVSRSSTTSLVSSRLLVRSSCRSAWAHLKEARSKNRGRLGASDELARDVLALAHEVEPWLSRAVERAKSA